jgi:hypothetical protein
MAIEIRELIIKASVVQEDSTGATVQRPQPNNNAVTPNEEMINICVDKVLEILRQKYER